MAKARDYVRMIHSPRWVALRRSVLNRCPLCEVCKQAGVIRSAREVHHVVPVESGRSAEMRERLMFDPENLQALCHDCHRDAHRVLQSHTRESIIHRQRQQIQLDNKILFGK